MIISTFSYTYVSYIIAIIQDIVFYNNNIACCAGVQKLVELSDNNSSIKTLAKYNFSLLKRSLDFYIDRKTIQELNKICIELNYICIQNVKESTTILNFEKIMYLDTEQKFVEIFKNINELYEKNSFLKENLRLCNGNLEFHCIMTFILKLL